MAIYSGFDFPIKNGGSFHCYVSLPEGIHIFCWHSWPIGSSEFDPECQHIEHKSILLRLW